VILTLTGFGNTVPREVLRVRGSLITSADDLVVQWSPDGTSVAASFWYYPTSGPEGLAQVVLLDAESGAPLGAEDGFLTGSLSFSADSRRLLMSTHESVLVHDLDGGGARPISFVPPLEPPRPGVPRLLGFADDTRLIVAVQRGRTMTVGTTDVDGVDWRPTVRWTGEHDMYPVFAAMPTAFWV
jgi:hypothetical protein